MQAVDEQLLTVAEVAELLRVAPSTVRRWIRDGDVSAHQVGKRRIGVRRSDLAALVKPVRTNPHTVPEPRREGGEDWRTVPKLTPDEQAKALAVVEDLRRMREELLAEREGRPFSPAWILVNEARDERSNELP